MLLGDIDPIPLLKTYKIVYRFQENNKSKKGLACQFLKYLGFLSLHQDTLGVRVSFSRE